MTEADYSKATPIIRAMEALRKEKENWETLSNKELFKSETRGNNIYFETLDEKKHSGMGERCINNFNNSFKCGLKSMCLLMMQTIDEEIKHYQESLEEINKINARADQ